MFFFSTYASRWRGRIEILSLRSLGVLHQLLTRRVLQARKKLRRLKRELLRLLSWVFEDSLGPDHGLVQDLRAFGLAEAVPDVLQQKSQKFIKRCAEVS